VDNEEKFVQNENENEGQEENIKEDSDIPRVFVDCEINKIPREEITNISRKDENVEDKLEMKHKDPEGKHSSCELCGVVLLIE
jgi:hypothetical protein